MAGQLDRSNSRSFVILGESEKSSPRLMKSDSLPYNSHHHHRLTPKAPPSQYHLTSKEKRTAFLGSVAERDSRGSSGGESCHLSFISALIAVFFASEMSPKHQESRQTFRSDSSGDSLDQSVTSTKSAAEKRQVRVSNPHSLLFNFSSPLLEIHCLLQTCHPQQHFS
jgi:hypothetical protein